MADYYAILKRAVVSLPDSTREQRQAVYDKARNALLKQLQGMNPPLPPSEISKQRVALEEAVRAVERDLMIEAEEKGAPAGAQETPEAAKASAPPVASSAPDVSAPPSPAGKTSSAAPTVSVSDASKPDESAPSATPTPSEVLESEDRVVRRAGQDVLKNAVRDAEKLGAATNAAVRSAQETADMVGDQRKGEATRIEPTLGDAVVSSSKTYQASSSSSPAVSGASKDELSGSGGEKEEKSSKFGLFASIAVAAVVLGGSSYLLYQNRAEFLGLGEDTPPAKEQTEARTSGGEDIAKSDDKPADGEMVAKNVRTVTVKPDQDPADTSSPATGESGESNTGADSGSKEFQQIPENGPVADSQNQTAKLNENAIQAIFYEENGTEGNEGQASPGNTIWNLEGEGDDAVVSISVDVPKRDIGFNLKISKNKDASLPASHLIEIEITSQGDGGELKVAEIPGLIMKPTEGSRGQGLFGEPVRIADDLHWIALTAGQKALTYNLELLELRQWIDMPILFQSGRRGILTVKKGESGQVVMADALRQWGK